MDFSRWCWRGIDLDLRTRGKKKAEDFSSAFSFDAAQALPMAATAAAVGVAAATTAALGAAAAATALEAAAAAVGVTATALEASTGVAAGVGVRCV